MPTSILTPAELAAAAEAIGLTPRSDGYWLNAYGIWTKEERDPDFWGPLLLHLMTLDIWMQPYTEGYRVWKWVKGRSPVELIAEQVDDPIDAILHAWKAHYAKEQEDG